MNYHTRFSTVHSAGSASIAAAVLAVMLALLLTVTLTSCATQPEEPLPPAPPATPPSISHSGTTISHRSFETAELLFSFHINNPSDTELELDRYSYELSSEGETVASGEKEPAAFRISGSTRASLDIPVRMPLSEPLPAQTADNSDRHTPYRLTVQADLTAKEAGIAGQHSLTASAEGRLSPASLPAIRIPEVVIPQFESLIINVEYEIEISNPNTFSVTLAPMDYVFSVEETVWAEDSLSRSLMIPAEEAESFTAALKINYLEAGRHTVNILVADKILDYRLRGSAAVSPAAEDEQSEPYRFSFDTAGTAAIIRP